VTRRLLIVLIALGLGAMAAIATPTGAAVARRPAVVRHKTAKRCTKARHGHRRPTCKPKAKLKPKSNANAKPKHAVAPTPSTVAPPPPTTTIPVVTTPITTTPPTTPPAAPSPPPVILPSRLGVDLQEYSVFPTHDPVAAGSVEFDVSNFGQDDHNLTIARDGIAVAQSAIVHPGAEQTLVATLAPGTYKLYCSLYDHDALGMHATLVIQ